MSSTFLEIVELADGRFVLKRTDSTDEPLGTIGFSSEAQTILSEYKGEIAKVMLSAGIQAYAAIAQQAAERDSADDSNGKTIH